jgi:hypothetical protein
LHNELELSSFNKKKSPIAVFNHLTSMIEKYLFFMPEQSFAYITLANLRQNNLFQWLLNISIYLGTIETPDEFIAQLERITREQNNQLRQQLFMHFLPRLQSDTDMSEMDHARIQAMIQQQQNILIASQNVSCFR